MPKACKEFWIRMFAIVQASTLLSCLVALKFPILVWSISWTIEALALQPFQTMYGNISYTLRVSGWGSAVAHLVQGLC